MGTETGTHSPSWRRIAPWILVCTSAWLVAFSIATFAEEVSQAPALLTSSTQETAESEAVSPPICVLQSSGPEGELTYGQDEGWTVRSSSEGISHAGDITSATRYASGKHRHPAPGTPRGAAFDPNTQLWPDGVVPYLILGSLDRGEALAAIEEWEQWTVLRFVEVDSTYAGHPPPLIIQTDAPGCSAGYGIGAVISGRDCGPFGYLHEIGHVIGLRHEHQRNDRDDYVMLNLDYTSNPNHYALVKQPHTQRVGPFDWDSIMLYEGFESIPPGLLGRGVSPNTDGPRMSYGDIDGVNRLYGKPPSATTIVTSPRGLEIVVDGDRVVTPATFHWPAGSTHVIEAPLWQTVTDHRDIGRNLFLRWNDGGDRIHEFTANPRQTWLQAGYATQVFDYYQLDADYTRLNAMLRELGGLKELLYRHYSSKAYRVPYPRDFGKSLGPDTVYLDPFDEFDVSRRAFRFVSSPAPEAAAQVFRLTNRGDGPAQYVFGSDSSWLSAFPTESTLAPGASASIDVRVDGATLSPDTHVGALTVAVAGEEKAELAVLPVTFVVLPEPVSSVQLGKSGDSVELAMSSTEGVLTLDGRPLGNGRHVTAANGDKYVLTKAQDGAVVARFVPQAQLVDLPGGAILSVTKPVEGEGWRVGDQPVQAGRFFYDHLHEGTEYRLRFGTGRWILDSFRVRLGASGSWHRVGIRSDGALDLGGAPDASERRVTAENGDSYSLTRGPDGAIVVSYVTRMQSLSLAQGVDVTLIKDREGEAGWRIGSERIHGSFVYVDADNEYLLEQVGPVWQPAQHAVRTVARDIGSVRGVALDASGSLILSIPGGLQELEPSGAVTALAVTAEAGNSGACVNPSGHVYSSTYVAVDGAGNIYLAHWDSHSVCRIDRLTGSIRTFAGTGEPGYSGDGGLAADAQLNSPQGLAVDADGNVYIADTWNHRVRRVDADTGVITSFAGTGEARSAGDGGPASEASLLWPVAVAVGPDGSVYVAATDSYRSWVRRIDPSGIIVTMPLDWSGGSERFRAAFLAVDEQGGIYVASDYPTGRIRAFDPAGGSVYDAGHSRRVGTDARDDLVAAAWAQFDLSGIAAGREGRLWFTDAVQQSVRVIEPVGIQRQSVALGEAASLAIERGADGHWRSEGTRIEDGHVLVRGGRAYVLAMEDEGWQANDVGIPYSVRSVAGTAEVAEAVPATSASLFRPTGIDVDSVGNVYVIESGRQQIRRVDVSGRITTFAGTGDWGDKGNGGPAVRAEFGFSRPSNRLPLNYYLGGAGVAVDAQGNVYVTDGSSQRVRRIDASTGLITAFGGHGGRWLPRDGDWGDGGPAAEANLIGVSSVAADGVGNVYVTVPQRVVRIDAGTGLVSTLAGGGSMNPRVGGQATNLRQGLSSFHGPMLAADAVGKVWVGNFFGDREIVGIDASTGLIEAVTDHGGSGLAGLDVDTTGNLYAALYDGTKAWGYRVERIDAATGLSEPLADFGPRPVGGLALDGVGNLYVTFPSDHRVSKLNLSTRTVSTFAGTGDPTGGWQGGPAAHAKLVDPTDIAIDGAGNLFFTDRNRVWTLDASDVIVSLAGTGEPGYDGDGGPPGEALLDTPTGVSLDSLGNVFVADFGNSRLRKVDRATGLITTVSGRFVRPRGLSADAAGSIYLTDPLGNRVWSIDTVGNIEIVAGTGREGGYLGSGVGGLAIEAQLNHPSKIAADAMGNVYVYDSSYNDGLLRIDAGSGVLEGVSTDDGRAYWSRISAVATDVSGNVFVGVGVRDLGGHRIQVIDLETGAVQTIAPIEESDYRQDRGLAMETWLSVSGMAVDKQGKVWFTDPMNRQVRVLEPWSRPN